MRRVSNKYLRDIEKRMKDKIDRIDLPSEFTAIYKLQGQYIHN